MCAHKILGTIKRSLFTAELTQELLVLLNLCADVYLSWPLLLLLLLACPCWCAIGHPFNFVYWLQPEKNAVSLNEINCHFWSTPGPGPWHIFPSLNSNTLMWKWSYCNGKKKNWLQQFLSGEKSQTSHDSGTTFSLLGQTDPYLVYSIDHFFFTHFSVGFWTVNTAYLRNEWK